MSLNLPQTSDDYHRIEQAILFLEDHFRQQPDLKTVADSVGLSEYHFQRLFTRWAGISPKRFLQFLTLEYAKGLLAQNTTPPAQPSLLDITYASGLSSPGRLHDLFITYEAMTPGDYKKQGQGLTISYGFHQTLFGEALLATTERGICGLFFVQADGRAEALADLKAHWPRAKFIEAPEITYPLVTIIFSPAQSANGDANSTKINILMRGTPFQLKVWQALLDVPPGRLVSYQDIAVSIEQPSASRAVGNAVAHNAVAYLIPCHRVIRKMGLTGPYRWGIARKKAIIGWEAAQIGVG